MTKVPRSFASGVWNASSAPCNALPSFSAPLAMAWRRRASRRSPKASLRRDTSLTTSLRRTRLPMPSQLISDWSKVSPSTRPKPRKSLWAILRSPIQVSMLLSSFSCALEETGGPFLLVDTVIYMFNRQM
ncbi:hypothetical protein D3C73_1341590 [compost metagenome]